MSEEPIWRAEFSCPYTAKVFATFTRCTLESKGLKRGLWFFEGDDCGDRSVYLTPTRGSPGDPGFVDLHTNDETQGLWFHGTTNEWGETHAQLREVPE